MKIDYSLMIKEAEKKEVSPYTLIKRRLNYREGYGNRQCQTCRYYTAMETRAGIKIQCTQIGVGADPASEIDPYNTCDNHKKKSSFI